jgi:hypothetical protein
MISQRSPFGVKRWSALAALLSVFVGSGCVAAGAYQGSGGDTGRPPETRVAPHVTDAGPARGPAGGAVPQTGCSRVALELIQLVNAYRAESSLPPIPASPSLCTVAATHTRDLADNAPHAQPNCNLHSWSSLGDWTPCCYTRDHAQAACMWNKPRELTAYRGAGYENAAAGAEGPSEALAIWQSSAAHNEVILSRGKWASHPWRAIGADVHEGFAVLWFGEEPDPAQ